MKKNSMPIGIKLNTIITLILLCSLSSILFFATQIFNEDNRNNINSLNAQIAKANAEKIKVKLKSVVSNLISIAKIRSENPESKALDHYFKDSSLITVGIFEKLKKTHRFNFFRTNPNAMEVYGLQTEILKSSIRRNLKSFQDSFAGKIKVKAEITGENFPILYVSVPFLKNEKGTIISIIVGAINHSTILSIFKDESIFTTYLLDEAGTVIAHPKSKKVIEKINYAYIPLVKSMLESKISTGQKEFTDDEGNEYLGAYSLVGISGIGVVSQVTKDKAYEATQLLITKSVKLSLIVLLISILLIYIFSNTITKPIAALLSMTTKIAQGIYGIKIQNKRKDEIGELASALEEMSEGLEERERLKNTFGKFVNKDLATKAIGGELTLGGEKKKVTVLFSDIRNFSTISENREPEEVLKILNEYMSLMVNIITKRGGVIDKFVGDAIMAVWGAPFPKESDAENAVMACLEMRGVLQKFNESQIKKDGPRFQIGMGLNTGFAIAGNMGSVERMEYTVVGDSVNLAARIEEATKEAKCDILINQSTVDDIKNLKLSLVECRETQVRGKQETIQLYKLIGVFNDLRLLETYTKDPNLIADPNRDEDSRKFVINLSKTPDGPRPWYVLLGKNSHGPYAEDNVIDYFSKNLNSYRKAKIFKQGYGEWRPPWHHSAFDMRIARQNKEAIRKNLNETIWFISIKGKKSGPYSINQIMDKVRDGKVFYDDSIWREGWVEWSEIREISEFNRRSN